MRLRQRPHDIVQIPQDSPHPRPAHQKLLLRTPLLHQPHHLIQPRRNINNTVNHLPGHKLILNHSSFPPVS